MRSGILKVLLGVSFSLSSSWSYAWDFAEHSELCQNAYKSACTTISSEGPQFTKPTIAQRANLACGSPSPLARVFGQACAIAGDHVDTPEDLSSALGGERATSQINYLSLALWNNEHFQPFSRRSWQLYHGRALAVINGRSADTMLDAERFERILFLEAFGQHFLQDSFAAGHLGFNRAASTVAAAKLFHDKWNDRGRWVRSPNGATWYAYGDGNLHKGDSFLRIQEAATRSVTGVLRAFVFGTPSDKEDYEVYAGIPSEVGERFTPEWLKARRARIEKSVKDYMSLQNSQTRQELQALTREDENPDATSVEFTSLWFIRDPAQYYVAVTLSPGFGWSHWSNSDLLESGMVEATLNNHLSLPVVSGYSLQLRAGYLGVTHDSRRKNLFAAGGTLGIQILQAARGSVRAELIPFAILSSTATKLVWGGGRIGVELGAIIVHLEGGVGYAFSDGFGDRKMYLLGLSFGRAFFSRGGKPMGGY